MEADEGGQTNCWTFIDKNMHRYPCAEVRREMLIKDFMLNQMMAAALFPRLKDPDQHFCFILVCVYSTGKSNNQKLGHKLKN